MLGEADLGVLAFLPLDLLKEVEPRVTLLPEAEGLATIPVAGVRT